MLHYDALSDVTNQHRRHREGEAETERLALEVRNGRQRRARRWALPGLGRIPSPRRHAVQQ
jgi:hypothetical protein